EGALHQALARPRIQSRRARIQRDLREGPLAMTTRIRHVAIVSDQYALLGRFYEAVFGMKGASDTRPERAVTVSDGYVGLNINPRKAGRPAGLDHFGLEVDDAEAACARVERYAGLHVVRRPSTRPFAAISAHDPAGNVFDISQAGLELRPREGDDPGFRVTDGRVTLIFIPWDIRDYQGSGITRPGPDHIGFRVE